MGDILSHRGVVHLHLNQKKKCLDDLKLSLSLEPENPYRYASLAYAKDFFGDIDGAIADYEKEPESNTPPEGEKIQPRKLEPDHQPTSKEVVRDVFTKRSVFKEFLLFIRN